MVNKVVSLNRISDVKQENGYSLDAQKKHAIEYCALKGYEIIETFNIIESAKESSDRKKFQIFYNYIKKYILKHKTPLILVIEKRDRLTRNYTDKESLEKFIRQGYLSIHFYKENIILHQFSPPSDFLIDNVMTAVNKHYIANLALETQKGMTQKAESGVLPGRVPLGYLNIRDGEKDKNGRRRSRIDIDQTTHQAVIRMFELRGLHHFTYEDIKNAIIEERLLEPNRLKSLSISGIEGILKNSFYDGEFNFQGRKYQGTHKLFVPQHVIKAVRDFDSSGHKKIKPRIFSNLLTCSVPGCGCSIVYDQKTKKLAKSGALATYHYYRCTDSKKVHKRLALKQKNLTEKIIWQGFSKIVNEIWLPDDLAELIAKKIEESHKKHQHTHKDRLARLNQEFESLQIEEEKLVDFYLAGKIDQTVYENKLNRIRSSKRDVERSIHSLESGVDKKFAISAQRIIELANKAESLWKSRPEEEKLNFIKTVSSNQRANGLTVEYDLKRPFELLAEVKKKAPQLSEAFSWCPLAESNHGHKDFQSFALPTELSGHIEKQNLVLLKK